MCVSFLITLQFVNNYKSPSNLHICSIPSLAHYALTSSGQLLYQVRVMSNGQPVIIFPQGLAAKSVPHVDLLMALKVLAPAEPLPALDAAIGLLSGVDPFVLLQVSSLAEAAAAHQAVVRFLPGVTPLMDPKVPDAAEGLPANPTHVVLFVPLCLQRRHCAPPVPNAPSECAEVRLDVQTRADVVLPDCLLAQILSHANHNLRDMLLETFRRNRFGFNVHAQ